MNTRAYLAEFIATFALLFVGVGSVVTVGNDPNGAGILTIALAHGLAIACLASSIGHVSGGHLNPAVTIGMWITGRMDAVKAIGYIVSQLLGAVAAMFALKFILPSGSLSLIDSGIPAFKPDSVTVIGATLMEFITTFFLVWVIFGTAVDDRGPKMGAWLIGLTVTLDIIVAGQVTGGAMNPARYVGPAILQSDFSQIVVYIAGPILGAVAAAIIYQNVILNSQEKASA